MRYHLFEHFGVSIGAISGVLAARGKRIDLFGVIVLALVAALGGGTLRDVILGSRVQVFWMADSSYVITAILTGAATFFIGRWLGPAARPLVLADAAALALFTILGAAKGEKFGVGSVNAVVLGVMTGVAGGIIRDVLVGEIPLVFQREIYLYATAAFAGATAFVAIEQHFPGKIVSQWVGVATILALRLAAIQWKWSLPIFLTEEK